jgi:hypothetical protein
MASLSQNDYSGTLPSADADPNNILPTGNALIALDPNEPAAVRQPVGSAMDAMDAQEDEPLDNLAAQLAAGKRIRITSKEQWAKMSPHQKEVVRAAMSSGGQITSNNAVRIYQDSVKRARANQVQTVTTSDGSKVDFVNGVRIYPEKKPEPVKRIDKEAEDGTIMMIHPLTGGAFPAWNEASGEAVRGKPKISEDNRVQFNQAHIELQRIQSELNQVNAIPTNKKVTQDDNGMWVPSDSFFGGENPEKVKARLLKDADYQSEKIRKIDPTNSVSAAAPSQPAATPSPTPSVTPSPTPRPNPMPTPSQNITKAQYDALAPGATFVWNGKTLTKK